jgi:transposase-like protein
MVKIMSRPRIPNNVVCPNPNCEYYLKEEGKDIRKQGKNSAGHQRYQCMHCKTFFVETANTPMYRRHISEEQLVLIGKLRVEKLGNRAISRVTGLTLVTVSRVIDDITLHATEFNALMAGKARVGPVELDEMWTFVKKNKRRLTKEQRTQISKAMHGFMPESSEIQSSS